MRDLLPLLHRHPRLAALALGIIAATGFEPFNLWPVALAAIALWLGLVHGAPDRRSVLWRGWVFGVGLFGASELWVQHPFEFQHAVPPVLGYLAVPLLAGYLGLYPMLAGWCGWRLRRDQQDIGPDIGFVVATAGAWTITEWARAIVLTGYPWNPLAVLWLPVPGVAQLAAWTGTYALSGLTLLVAGTIMLAIRRHWLPAALSAAALAALMLGGLAARPGQTPDGPAMPHVVVVQPNLPEEADPGPDYAERNLAALIALSAPARSTGPRLIVWPEGALRYLIEDGYPQRFYFPGEAPLIRSRIAAILRPGDLVLTGGNALVTDSSGGLTAITNSVFALDSSGAIVGRYDKAHLVPFGEYLPLRPVLSAVGLDKLVQSDVDFAPGPKRAGLDLPPFGRIGVDICYEIIFSGQTVDAAHRPALIFNPSNDSWFGDWGPRQHLAQARLRAIEEGLPILRATPSGVSAVIAADGRLLGSVGLHRDGVVELPVPPALPPTLFSQLGNWIALAFAVAMLATAVAIRRRPR